MPCTGLPRRANTWLLLQRASVQLFWTNVNSSLALVAQMLPRSTTPAEPTVYGEMAPAETQLAASLPSTWWWQVSSGDHLMFAWGKLCSHRTATTVSGCHSSGAKA